MNKKTQKEKIIDFINSRGYITTLDAMLKLSICDLQSNIRDLKNSGFDIKSAWVQNKKTKKVFKVYALKQKEIDRYIKKFA